MNDLDISIQFNHDKPAEHTRILCPLILKDRMYEVLKDVCDLEIEIIQGKTAEKDGHVEWIFDCSDEKAAFLRQIITELFEGMMNSQKFKHN